LEFDGEHRLAAPRRRVWQILNDVAALEHAIPGCERLEALSPETFRARVRAKVGPLDAAFALDMELSDVVAPERYMLAVRGAGGAAGAAEGVARVLLEEQGGATLLRYTVDFKVRGKLAQVGSRLLMNAIRKLSGEFFAAFAERLDQQLAPAGAGPDGS
jgi:carbon monoxide dehydrogenase subunit G